MELIDQNKLAFFIIFILPGLMSMKTYSLICPHQGLDFNQKILDALTYSCILLAINFGLVVYVEKNDFFNQHIVGYSLAYLWVLAISPIILAIVWHKIRSWKWLQKHVQHPTALAWDFVFQNRPECVVIVTLTDGRKIYGHYGAGSFVTGYPYEPQIYLSQQWHTNADGGFDRPYNGSEGILIVSKDIISIEFFSDGIKEEVDE